MNPRSPNRAGWQKDVAPPPQGSRPGGLPPVSPRTYEAWLRLARSDLQELRDAARSVVSAYEGVTTSDDWMALVMPIVRLRAVLNQDPEPPA